MVDVAGNVGGAVSPVLQLAEWLAAPIWRPFKYLFNYTANFKNLEEEVKNLKSARDGIQHDVTAAERNVEEIKQNVTDWQKDVEKTITEAKQLIQAKADNPRYFKGLCPNFIIHYKQSRKAFKLKRDDIDRLLQKEKELSPISKPTNPPDRRFIPDEDYLTFESRNSLEKNVGDALNDENVYMIGVYGMGGLGKTTLVEELGRKAKKDKLFEDIVFVEVSESPDVKKIQTTIAHKLGLKFENESEMGDKIYSRMKDKNILVILDNIWEPLELDRTIGIPRRADRGRNKLLFTTRNLDVLERMGSTSNFGMGILNEEEAWTLFTKMAGNIIQKRELHSLQNDVCKKCGGLPLVISVIAKALRNKGDPSNWMSALQDLQGLSAVGYTGSLKKEYMQIALSYKYLSDELKKTFLICSLMENNTSISDLFRHVVCLNILGGVNLTMEDARVRLDKLVHDLKDACLLLDGFKSSEFAMHDVIRDVAIAFAHVEHHVFTTRNDVERDWKDRDKLKKCTKISLPGENTIISQLWPNNLDCPNLEYLYMTDVRSFSFKLPEDFFKVMPKLRVLNLVGLRQNSLPSSIHHLKNLQTLCLHGSSIEGVPIIGKLNELKVLSLRGSLIKEFPTEIGQLTQLRLLDLSNCYLFNVIAPNVISKLSQLEELYLKGCLIQWKIEVLEELKLLSSLSSLELDIKDEKVLPKNFFSRKLIRYNISVGYWLFEYSLFGKHEHLRMLELIIDPTINLEELCVIKNVELLCLAEYLDYRGHSKFSLQSNEITPLFNRKVIFSYLKVLVLKNIISRKIWDNQLPSSSFQNLKELILWRCTKIKFVFPYTITKNLQQLQYLEIKDCIDLEEIVATEEITEVAASFVFPEVTFLKLENLPELATFYLGIHTLECPKLQKLVVKNCDKFKMLNSEPNSLCLDQKINHDLEEFELKSQSMVISWNRENKALEISSDESTYNPLPLLQRFQSLEELKLYDCEYKEIKSVFDLPNLNVLHVQECSKLVSLVPSSPSAARSLVRLKELSISHCGMLAEILENKGDATTIEIVFQKLTKLSLDWLESLTCFCSGNHSLNFPSLEELIITKCSNMDTFFREISNVSEFTLQSNEIMLFFNQKVHFRDLKILELKNISFENIWDSQLLTSSYQNLTHLTLFGCDKIKYVFPLSIAKNLQQLQYLELTFCEVLERIIAPQEGTEASVNFFFPQVSTVKFQYLPEFTDFYLGTHTSEWPKLKELVVDYCGKFKMLTSEPNLLCFDQKINHDLEIFQLNSGWEKIGWWSQSKVLEISYYKSAPNPLWLLQRFQNLTCLFIYGCHDLVNLTTSSTVRSLAQLRELKISQCEMLMEILEIEEDATVEIVFENLNKLSFEWIENLICFCSGNYTFNFPSLKELNITKCLNMKSFCRGVLSTPKLQKINYERMEVENEGNNLNKTIQGLYKKKNQDISLDLNLKWKAFHHDNSTEIRYNQHPISFYQNLTHLFLWKCENIKHVFPSSIAKSLHQLQQLKIQNCKVLEEIVAKEEGANSVFSFIFPNITLLKLEDLPELTVFYHGIITLEMPKLKELVVKDCTKYLSFKENNVETELDVLAQKSIFLNNKININLEAFELYDGNRNICWQSQSKTLTIYADNSADIPLRLLQNFENVTKLRLFFSRYKNIKSLCDLPNHEVLEVCFYNGLTTLMLFSASFPNLKVLNVSFCNGLMKLITPSMARSLVQLRELNISCCEMLTEVVENEGNATTSTKIVFNNLNKLSLKCLESFTCFCSGNYSFSFPSLEELKIQNCLNLEIFCQGSLSTPKLGRVLDNFFVIHGEHENVMTQVEIEENDLNTTIQQKYKKEVDSFRKELSLHTSTETTVSFSGVAHTLNVYSHHDLTKAVVRTLNQRSNVISMDFHPQQQTILLVGTNVGDISIWEVGSRERLAHKSFKVWDISAVSMPLQTALLNDAVISVNQCVWGPDGLMLGVAFSKHIVQTYTYDPTGELRQRLEIDAHVGGVNDIAFAYPNKQLCIVTCGDDKTIKVWDAVAGCRQFVFEGHEAPVYSVCPHHKENIQFIFSTAIDGKIKAWLYNCLGSRVDYDAPGHWCTMMAYSADGTRLFSCGTSKEGESHLVEWNESEGAIKRTYLGFRKRSLGVVQFDTTRNRFLAAGDEFQIKFWDMDKTNMLTAVDADGGLPASPRLRFNKEGSLLAVTTSDSGIKILANSDGLRLIRMLESRAIDKNRVPSEPINSKPLIVNALGPMGNVSGAIASTLDRPDRVPPAVSINSLGTMDSSRLVDVKPRIVDDGDKVKSWKIPDVSDSSQMKALRLPDSMAPSKVVRLIYTNSGLALLALTSSAVHKLWKWQRSERNPSGKATAYVVPQLWQPPSGTLMTNDINDGKPAEESAACIALSKNDSYVMSASGGKVSLFNMMTFKVMTMFMLPPPAATFLAFHPQDNNIIAIGMEDSTIQIYNVRVDEVKTKLKGHQNRITGLAFSQTLNALVSSGADAQLCMWSIDKWEKLKCRLIQAPAGRQSPLVGETKVQFHNDQTHLLVVHDSQISIYDSKLECSRSWSPKDTLPAPISSAIYSCDGLLVYAGFCDGAVGVFDADNLRLRCRIAPSAYIPSFTGSSTTTYPFVIAAHPSEPYQIALGMSDGAVHVVEPSDTELKWGGTPSQDNGSLPSNSSNPSLAGQPSDLPPR